MSLAIALRLVITNIYKIKHTTYDVVYIKNRRKKKWVRHLNSIT